MKERWGQNLDDALAVNPALSLHMNLADTRYDVAVRIGLAHLNPGVKRRRVGRHPALLGRGRVDNDFPRAGEKRRRRDENPNSQIAVLAAVDLFVLQCLDERFCFGTWGQGVQSTRARPRLYPGGEARWMRGASVQGTRRLAARLLNEEAYVTLR